MSADKPMLTEEEKRERLFKRRVVTIMNTGTRILKEKMDILYRDEGVRKAVLEGSREDHQKIYSALGGVAVKFWVDFLEREDHQREVLKHIGRAVKSGDKKVVISAVNESFP